MKKFIIGAYTLCSFSLFGQASFDVVTAGSEYSISELTNAINNANMCGFHFINERRVLHFNDGSVVELYKQSEVSDLGVDCFIQKPNGFNEYDNVWEIKNSGHLVRRIAINPTK